MPTQPKVQEQPMQCLVTPVCNTFQRSHLTCMSGLYSAQQPVLAITGFPDEVSNDSITGHFAVYCCAGHVWRAVNCVIAAAAWSDLWTNHRHSTFFIPHFSFRIPLLQFRILPGTGAVWAAGAVFSKTGCKLIVSVTMSCLMTIMVNLWLEKWLGISSAAQPEANEV